MAGWQAGSTAVGKTADKMAGWQAGSTAVGKTADKMAGWQAGSTPVGKTADKMAGWHAGSTAVGKTADKMAGWHAGSTAVGKTADKMAGRHAGSTAVGKTADKMAGWQAGSTAVGKTADKMAGWQSGSTAVGKTADKMAGWQAGSTAVGKGSDLRTVRFLSIKPVVDGRPAMSRYLRDTSVVYARRGQGAQWAWLGQRHVTQLRLDDWRRYCWTLPGIPPTRPRQRPEISIDLDLEVPPHVPRISASVTPETEVRRLPLLGQPLLRRPPSRRLHRARTDGGHVLGMLGNYLRLRPVQTTCTARADFYSRHFPLVLQSTQMAEGHSGSEVVSHRHLASRLEEMRLADLDRRCQRLDAALMSLALDEEEDSGVNGYYDNGEIMGDERGEREGAAFVTELRHDVFDPRAWNDTS